MSNNFSLLPTIHPLWTHALTLPPTPRASSLRRILRTVTPSSAPPLLPPRSLIPLYLDLALTYAFLGEYYLSTITFDEALARDASHAFAWYGLGLANAELADWRGAKAAWKQCLQCFQDRGRRLRMVYRLFEGEKGEEKVINGGLGQEFVLEREDVKWNCKIASYESRSKSPGDKQQGLNGIPAGVRFGPDWDFESSSFIDSTTAFSVRSIDAGSNKRQAPTRLLPFSTVDAILPLKVTKATSLTTNNNNSNKSTKTSTSSLPKRTIPISPPPFPPPTKPLPPIPVLPIPLFHNDPPPHHHHNPPPLPHPTFRRASNNDSPTQGRYPFPTRSSSLFATSHPVTTITALSPTITGLDLSTSAPSALSTQIGISNPLEVYLEARDREGEGDEDQDGGEVREGGNDQDVGQDIDDVMGIWDQEPYLSTLSEDSQRRKSKRSSRYSKSEDALANWTYRSPTYQDPTTQASTHETLTEQPQAGNIEEGETLLPQTYQGDILLPTVFEGFGPER